MSALRCDCGDPECGSCGTAQGYALPAFPDADILHCDGCGREMSEADVRATPEPPYCVACAARRAE